MSSARVQRFIKRPLTSEEQKWLDTVLDMHGEHIHSLELMPNFTVRHQLPYGFVMTISADAPVSRLLLPSDYGTGMAMFEVKNASTTSPDALLGVKAAVDDKFGLVDRAVMDEFNEQVGVEKFMFVKAQNQSVADAVDAMVCDAVYNNKTFAEMMLTDEAPDEAQGISPRSVFPQKNFSDEMSLHVSENVISVAEEVAKAIGVDFAKRVGNLARSVTALEPKSDVMQAVGSMQIADGVVQIASGVCAARGKMVVDQGGRAGPSVVEATFSRPTFIACSSPVIGAVAPVSSNLCALSSSARSLTHKFTAVGGQSPELGAFPQMSDRKKALRESLNTPNIKSPTIKEFTVQMMRLPGVHPSEAPLDLGDGS